MRNRIRNLSRRTVWSGVAALVAVVGVGVGGVVWVAGSGDGGSAVTAGGNEVRSVSAEELTEAGRVRVFLGHQSVGMNLLDGVRLVYRRGAVTVPPVLAAGEGLPARGGYVAHAFIGVNGDPLGKIKDFDRQLRAGTAGRVDVAMMKLCYIDITGDTDVDALFSAYRETLRALQQDYPDVTFVHSTVPLTTEAGRLARLKTRLGGSDRFGQAENVVRERLNTLIRQEYTDDHLFDLAAIESTAPDGVRAGGRFQGQPYYVLYPGYAADEGHLNDLGAATAAAEWLRLIRRAARG
jgi:hypothetical protein